MGVVAFGILHLIGVSIILAYPSWDSVSPTSSSAPHLRRRPVHPGQDLTSEGLWLSPFGVLPEGVMMPDYRPLLPWFGVVLVGVFFGNVVYRDGLRRRARRTRCQCRRDRSSRSGEFAGYYLYTSRHHRLPGTIGHREFELLIELQSFFSAAKPLKYAGRSGEDEEVGLGKTASR